MFGTPPAPAPAPTAAAASAAAASSPSASSGSRPSGGRFAAESAPRVAPEGLIAEPTSTVEKAKRAAARRAVDENVSTGMRVGIGSGSTIVYAVQRLAERARDEGLDIVCVPTSFQATEVRC